ncbi:hypothetical protein L1785_20760 [Antribacter sp. KLBMP9083]|uniref:Uncharacterized protein n=1 Tax=Antribacter soli TaxID=2910976 RepID=A0AA41QJI6_9MICO|nr:hypothetical protein [Antribacter soli]MCF4123402.1 hypothetical protein [Antribacter soli]
MSQPTPPQQPAFVPDALLKFTVQGNIMTSNMVPPSLTIDGYPAPTAMAGTRDIPIMSGRHHLRVHSQWLRSYGHAVIDVDISPGQTVEVFYAPPYHQFADHGSVGLTRQARNGRGAIIGMWVVIGLIFVIPLAVTLTLG